MHKLGVWDVEDLNVNGKNVSIKSTKSFGNLLLLEEKDWNSKGVYLPNQKKYDFTFLIRMNPYCEESLKKNGFYIQIRLMGMIFIILLIIKIGNMIF